MTVGRQNLDWTGGGDGGAKTYSLIFGGGAHPGARPMAMDSWMKPWRMVTSKMEGKEGSDIDDGRRWTDERGRRQGKREKRRRCWPGAGCSQPGRGGAGGRRAKVRIGPCVYPRLVLDWCSTGVDNPDLGVDGGADWCRLCMCVQLG